MPRFKVKTNTLVTEVDSQAQLRHFAETGVCAPDSLVKQLPDGSWTRANQHPALRALHWPPRDPDTGDLLTGPPQPPVPAAHAPPAVTGPAAAHGACRNLVVTVHVTGGLIGLLAGSSVGSLNRVIRHRNAQGWRVVQVLPYDGGNLSIKLFQAVLLVCTCFLWTFGAGWIVILELAPPRRP